MAYLDTSVLGSYYCPESLSTAVSHAISHLDKAIISPLVEVELCSLLSLKVRSREMTPAAAREVLALFNQHVSSGYYEIHEIASREHDFARAWLSGFNTPLRALDALHLACAFAQGHVLWTTDKPLSQSAKALGIKCKLIT